MIRIREIYGYVKTSTCIGIPRNTDDSLGSGTKLLLPSWLLGFQHEERETQFLLCWLFPPNQPPAAYLVNPNLPGLVELRKSTRPVSVQISTNCFFQNNQESQPIASRYDVIHIPSPIFYSGFLSLHLWLSHPPRASATPALNVCPYPCTKPKSSKPN